MLVRERGERGRVEREREGVRSEVERERRGRETAEGKVEEMNKVVAEKSDDIQAKARMIAKVCVHNIYSTCDVQCLCIYLCVCCVLVCGVCAVCRKY